MGRYINFDGCALEIVQEFGLNEVSGILHLKDKEYQLSRVVLSARQLVDFLDSSDFNGKRQGTNYYLFNCGYSLIEPSREESDPRGAYLRVNLRYSKWQPMETTT